MGPETPGSRRADARGGGLEPPMTGPEPVVLPITPPPIGCRSRLPDLPDDDALDTGLAAEADDPADSDGDGLAAHVGRDVKAADGTRPRRRRRRVQAELRGHTPDAEGVKWVRDEDDVLDVAVLEEGGRRGQRLPRRVAGDLPKDVGVGHALRVEVVGAGRRLGEVVARLTPAGDDDVGRDAPMVEVCGVVEPGFEDSRRPSVVLGGAEDDDGLGLMSAVSTGG